MQACHVFLGISKSILAACVAGVDPFPPLDICFHDPVKLREREEGGRREEGGGRRKEEGGEGENQMIFEKKFPAIFFFFLLLLLLPFVSNFWFFSGG